MSSTLASVADARPDCDIAAPEPYSLEGRSRGDDQASSGLLEGLFPSLNAADDSSGVASTTPNAIPASRFQNDLQVFEVVEQRTLIERLKPESVRAMIDLTNSIDKLVLVWHETLFSLNPIRRDPFREFRSLALSTSNVELTFGTSAREG